MRGTFNLPSRTFYHHLNKMREDGQDHPHQVAVDHQQAVAHDPETSSQEKSLVQSPQVEDYHPQSSKVGRIRPAHADGGKSCEDQEDTQHGREDTNSRLLPSLPNELTIDQILTKVPWTKLLLTLPFVSCSWHHVIRNLQVHNARIRTRTTQTLIAMIHQTLVRKSIDLSRGRNQGDVDDFVHTLAISLYDPCRDRWYLLPSIAGVDRGIPYACECVCLEGKVYILGGYGNFSPTSAVYELDLAAGMGVWRQCASMRSARVGFSGAAKDGKLYVFGGTRSGALEISSECLEAEVFDPENNTWTSIAPTIHRHTSHGVACLGGQFIVHGGRCWTDVESDDDSDNRLLNSNRITERIAEVYDPCKNEWHEVKDFAVGISGAPVVVEGKLHIISERDSCIYLYDKHANSWAASQTISWGGLGFEHNPTSNVMIEATACGGEILAAMCSWNMSRFRSGLENWEDQIVLLKSRGLGHAVNKLEWERIASADEFHKQILCMRPLQL